MNCVEANRLDLADYLYSLGPQPKKISNKDYSYLLTLREEKKPSLKVNKTKNIWYDHGMGKRGTLVDFAMAHYHCNLCEALENISSFHTQNELQNNILRQPFHSHESKEIIESSAREMAVKIIAAKEPITDPMLCRYFVKRRVEIVVANKYCHKVYFILKDKKHKAIGFKNNAARYKLRNEYFKGGSSPKYFSYLDNKASNISVFEGFFAFLSYQTIHRNQDPEMTNFLILNSLSFFERSLLLIKKYGSIKLYLDNDNSGRKHASLALKDFLNPRIRANI